MNADRNQYEENGLFKKNLRVLRQYHPHAVDLLEKPPSFQMEVRCGDSSVPNLCVNLNDGDRRMIYPAPDPLQGLPDFLDSLQGLKGRIVSVFGFALGHYAFALWERYGRDNVFVIFEAVPAVLKLAMTHMDLRRMLADPRVRIVMDNRMDLTEVLTREEDVVFAYSNPKYITFHAWTRFREEWYRKAKEALERYIISKKNMNVTLKGRGRLFFKNRHHNLRAMAASHPLKMLGNRFEGIPAVVVSTGPSLSKNIDHLRDVGGRALLIAVDSAAVPLHQNGIAPDFIVSMDPNRFTYEKLFPLWDILHRSRLIFTPEITPSILDNLRFQQKYYTYLGNNYESIFKRLLGVDAEFIPEAQSVTHLALHSAQLMGCNPIVFVGLDLAFSEKRDHAEGTVLHWGNNQSDTNITVLDIHGQMVQSSYEFINMLHCCEKLIQKVPDRIYIDATEGGARIGGTRIMTLSDAIRGFDEKTLPMLASTGTDGTPLRSGTLLNNLQALQHDLLDKKNRVASYFQKTRKIDAFFSTTPCDFRSQPPYPNHVGALLNQADRLNLEMDRDDMNRYLSDLLGESNEAYIDYNKRLFEAELNGDPKEIFFARYEKQKFVQQNRKDALETLQKELADRIGFFKELGSRRDAMVKNRESLSAVFDMAGFLVNHGALAEAEMVLKGISPDGSPEAAFLMGCIQVKCGRVMEGLDLMDGAISMGYPGPDRRAIVLAATENEWLDACTPDSPLTFRKLMAERILMLDPEGKVNSTAMIRLLTSVTDRLFNQNHADDAIELLEKTMRTHLANAPSLMLQSARFLVRSGRYEAGLARLQEAVRIDPRTAVLWEEIGDMLYEGKGYASALAAYENCCRALPDRWEVFRKIGNCYMSMGKPEAAEAAFGIASDNRRTADD